MWCPNSVIGQNVGDGLSLLYTTPSWSKGSEKFEWMNESTWHPTWYKVDNASWAMDVCIRACKKMMDLTQN